MDSLVIEATSLSNFLAQADANFPFKTLLLVQALDADSRVITDGPDSTLVKTLIFFLSVLVYTVTTTIYLHTLLH